MRPLNLAMTGSPRERRFTNQASWLSHQSDIVHVLCEVASQQQCLHVIFAIRKRVRPTIKFILLLGTSPTRSLRKMTFNSVYTKSPKLLPLTNPDNDASSSCKADRNSRRMAASGAAAGACGTCCGIRPAS